MTTGCSETESQPLINCINAPASVKLKCQARTLILSLYIAYYSMRDVICDVNYCGEPQKLRYG